VANVGPDPAAGPAAQAWAERFQRRFGEAPSSYSLTAYTAVAVVAKAVAHVAASGRPITRSRLRDAIQAVRLPDTPQGMVSFDANGDLERPVVSIYQVRSGAFQYVGAVAAAGAPRVPGGAARP
jgi:ABC-type branched-subunit amino acid transport system substrate-binding protein